MANFPVFQGGQLTQGVALRQRRKALEQQKKLRSTEQSAKRQQRIRKTAEDLRVKALEGFRQFVEQAGLAAEQGVDPNSDVIQKAGVGAKAALGTYVNYIQGLKKAVVIQGNQEGLPQEQIEKAIMALPDASQFVSNNMPLFDLAVEAGASASEQGSIRTLTPEEIQALPGGQALPEGMIIQQREGGPNEGELLIKFEPPAAGEDLSSFQEQVNALMATGVPEEIAVGIKAGRFAVSLDPISRERAVIDLATGERIGEPLPPAPQPDEVPPLIPEDIETGLATGGPGFFRNMANIVKGAFNAEPFSEEAQVATEALTTLQKITATTLMADIADRDSVFLLKQLSELTVTPNSFLQGASRAKDRLEQTKLLIDGEIARMENQVLPMKLDPSTRVETEQNLTRLRRISEAYESAIGGFEETEEEVDPEVQSLLDKYAPEGQARD